MQRSDPFRAVLVDDEPAALRRLERMLQPHQSAVRVIGKASDGAEAIGLLEAERPDLVFLDIGLPDMDGFEVLKHVSHAPLVVFVTATTDRALSAFRANAIDYLVKPIDASLLQQALDKLTRFQESPSGVQLALQQLMASLGTKYLTRLQCTERGRTLLVPLEEVMYLQSDTKLTAVHTAGSEYLLDRSLVDLEAQLDPRQFIRVHRATLVNAAWIKEFHRFPDGKVCIILRDAKATEIVGSRGYADKLRAL